MKLPEQSSAWLTDKSLQAVFDAIESAGGEVRVAGGAVRNTLMGKPVGDVDLCTTLLPGDTVKALEAAGIKAVPTGFEHGTVTAVMDGNGFEVTTLREDIETDGRHAVVRFGTNWLKDAQRRDLTMNALYCDRNGTLYDPLNGMSDVMEGQVKFIGEAAERIEEDYLRILRFFRFFAQYGSGRPDAEGLKACTRLKDGLARISAERIWAELRKTLDAPDPSRALLWMRTTGVLGVVLPESAKWGIDLVPAMIRAEQRYAWKHEAMRRLASIIRPNGENVTTLAKRLKLSKADQARLLDWAMEDAVDAHLEQADFERRLYFGKPGGMIDRMVLQTASALEKQDEALADAMAEKVEYAASWKRPEFPVKGKDLLAIGERPGEKMGQRLSELEKRWVASGFTLSKAELLGD